MLRTVPRTMDTPSLTRSAGSAVPAGWRRRGGFNRDNRGPRRDDSRGPRRDDTRGPRRDGQGGPPDPAGEKKEALIMLLPKRVKYRRVHRGRLTGKATRGKHVTYGEFGLVATEPAWITSNQIEAARIAMTRYTSAAARCGLRFPR